MPGLWKIMFGKEKFLVLRRDGTVPEWPWFVLGAPDQAAPAGLRAYADKAEELEYSAEYVQDVRELASFFEKYFADHESGDPTAPPHRQDNPMVVALLKYAGRE